MNAESRNIPNIILILSDNQDEWTMGCSGNNEIIIPNIDQLAEDGIRFTNIRHCDQSEAIPEKVLQIASSPRQRTSSQ